MKILFLRLRPPAEALKSGPMANRPGLHLDPESHRWTRIARTVSPAEAIPDGVEHVDRIDRDEMPMSDVPRAFAALRHGGTLRATIKNRPAAFDAAVLRSGGSIDGDTVTAVRGEPARPADQHFEAAFDRMQGPIARWVNLEENKQAVADAFHGLTTAQRDALYHANKEAFAREHGGEWATLYRSDSHKRASRGLGLSSMSSRPYRDDPDAQAYRVHFSDVLMHYGAKTPSGRTSPLGHGGFAHEQEVILKPSAQAERLTRPAEAAKAKSRGDNQTLELFDHAGLHAERRTDKAGRTETRWVADPTPRNAEAIAKTIAKHVHAAKADSSDYPGQERVEANWRKRLRGFTVPEDFASQIDEAQAANADSDAFQAVVARHGPPHPVAAPKSETGGHAAVGNLPNVPMLALGKHTLADDVPRPGLPTSSSSGGLAATIRHEHGHHVWKRLTRDAKEAWAKAMPTDPDDAGSRITMYAARGANWQEEAFCEALAIRTHRRWDREQFPEPLLDLALHLATHGHPAEALKDVGEGHKAPKLGFGQTGPAGERWLTITPPGADHGHPVLIHVDPHNPRIGRVIGGAGGKLNYLKIHLKTPEQYRKQAAERAKMKRAKAAEARAAGKEAGGDGDAAKTRNQAIKAHEEALTAQHGEAYERVAKALGWTDIEPDPKALEGLDEKTQAKVKRDHAAQLKKDVRAAVERARMLLTENADALHAAGVREFSAKASPDRPAVEDLVGMDSLRRGLGYAPERADLDDPEIRAEKIRVIEGRFRDEKAAGNAEGAASLAQRLAMHRPISADEIDQASPEALAGYARAAVARLDTLREHAAVVNEGAPAPEAMEALQTLESDAPTLADALDNASAPSSAAALRDTLKKAAEAGLLDPQAHHQREAALEGARFDAVGAPLPDELAPEAVDELDAKQVDVLVAEAAKRARTSASAPEDVRRDAAKVPPAGEKKKGGDPKDAKTADIEDEIEKKRQADNLGEDGIAVGGMDTETKRDFLRRAMEAGLIGADAAAKGKEQAEQAKARAPKRKVNVDDPETAARLLLADRAIRDLHKQRRDLRAAKESGKPIAGIDDDTTPAWRSEKDGVLDLQHDNAATSPEVVAQVENDLRTIRARSFLNAVNETNDTFAEQSGFRPDETHAELARHVSFGAADALNEHAQTILGQPAIDRQVIDTLGAAAAAQIVAWAAHQERPDDVEAIAAAVGEHHAKTQVQTADEAYQAGVDHAAKAHEIHQHLQTATGDLRTLAALNTQRIHHYDEARKTMGRALGQMEATAALHEALARGKPPTEIRAAMGTQDAVSVAKSARALGLATEDFEVQTEGTNSWLKIKESGFSKLRAPSDPDGARLDADMLAIKRGDKDEHGWLPAGLTRRADPPKRDIPPPKMHSEPFDYSLEKHGSIEEAMRTYVAQRAHDGMSPTAIHEDLLHGGHQAELTKAHDTKPAAQGSGADMDQWHADNPEPDRHTFDMFDPDGPERAWQAWDKRRQDAAGAGAGPGDAGRGAKALGKDEAVKQWGAAMDKIMPSRHYDPKIERDARQDAAKLEAGGEAAVAALHAKYNTKTHEDLRKAINERASGAVGRRMSENMAAEIKGVAAEHAEKAGKTDGMLHHQDLDDETARDATFRALAAHPAASVAFKPPASLTQNERKALRAAFDRYHGVKDEDRTAAAKGLADWHAKNPEPERKIAGLFGEEDNPEHAAWTAARAQKHAEAGADTGATWEDYVRAHRSPAAAYAAMQDQVKGRFLAEFKAHHEALSGQPIKAGAAPISGWREHSHALNPEWREASRKDHEAAASAERDKNRDQGGRYGRGPLTEGIEKRLEAEAATKQQNTGLALGGGPPVAPSPNAAPQPHERVTLGDKAEAQIAKHVSDFAPMIDPSKNFAARSSLRMDGDKIRQQRAVRAWTRAGKIGLFEGPGSGKTNISFGAFGELRKAGRAERGLFAVPSNVQGQFGTEALAFTEPGATRWWAKPGAPKAERMAAYRDPGAHMVVVTHQALRDDVTDMVAEHLGMDRKQVVEGMTGFDAEGNEAQAWTREQMDQHVGEALRKAGAEKLLDFLAVDEGHVALNRAGKQDSHIARVVDSLFRLSKHAGFMTGSPVKNDPSEVYDGLAKIAHHKYHDGPGGISRAAFMRRYGSDMPATQAALARELHRYTVVGKVSPGTAPNYHHETLKPTDKQSKRLAEIEDAYRRARHAGRSSAVDVEAMKTLAPHRFEGRPDEEHHEIAQSMSKPLTLAGVRDAAYDRAIHLDEDGAKLTRLRELASTYKGQDYPRQDTESDAEHKARVARGDTTRRAGVVFARQLDAIPKIKAALEKDGHEVVDVTGTMSSEEKQKRLDAYKAGKGTILLASDAIEAGSNLQRASWLAHYNVPQTFKGWDQRSARINRIGQKFTNLDVHTLTLDHESEHRKMATMQRKEALADALQQGAAGMLDDSGLSREIREHIARRRAEGSQAAG